MSIGGPLAVAAADFPVYSASNFKSCMMDAAKASPLTVVWPVDAEYEQAAMCPNVRNQVAHPTAVVYAKATADVVNTVQVNLSSNASASGNLTAWTGAGITNALLVAELYTKGPAGVASLSGSCPSVGTGGYYLGGGMGILSPKYGLGCDQVVALEVVLANGTVVTVDAEHHSDLFWAACGGGPGFGIVTRYKVKGIFLGSKDAGTEAFLASGLLEVGGVVLDQLPPVEYPSFGIFMFDEYMRLMNDWNGKLLEQELGHIWDRSNPEHYAKFLQLALQPGSLVSSAEHKFWRWFVMNACYMVPELSPAALKALMDFQSSPTIDECAAAVAAGAGKSELTEPIEYLCLAKELSNSINWNHLLGGAVSAVPSDATAYPHRKMISPLCHEPSMPYGSYDSNGELLPSANFTLYGVTMTYKPALLLEAFIARIKQFQRALVTTTPNIGTYYNYILPSLEDWQHSYWGANYPRLQRVKAAYDPRDMFTKPYTVEQPVRNFTCLPSQ
ncbi:hypothetical protein HYH02_006609 [Chlamydomonas schloesseri]|uniref:FAD-binding PCMH-type domain-containing protein n=1 Tax=Chlamydomonas schloesseri TaxID=2026947 RepID=A0A835TEW1_9CHLO|nr:hypothetical protein HYH02_006609 [Chlamydomonas schloesseri]|eukprot:KAG2439084.1 hypothetical protein HYH02_006609 [Chlamydomonas schloesseri]